ncbi:MAG: cation-translocating P-type ATPase [Candidatus Peregrinibacteria bacterium]
MKQFFYQLTVEEAVAKLGTYVQKGLTQVEAARRLKEVGPNQLEEFKKRSMILRFLDQFKDLMIVVLIVAGLLAYYLGDFHSGTVLLVIVLINACMGFYQEFKAERILASLKKMVRGRAIVVRDGQRREIDSAELVPGDVVYLEEGSAVPADVRLIETTHFSTNDFILTGESVPQEKKAELVFDKVVTVSDQDNCVFLGTTVAKGNSLALVYGTGMNTAVGRIAKTSQEIEETSSPLQLEFNDLAKLLTKLAGCIALGIFVLNFFLNLKSGQSVGALVQLSILFALGVAAACVPQGLPAQVSVALSLGVGRMVREKAVVKKLSAVETLGCTTLICSDKTGTITKNEMTILDCYVMHRRFKVTGAGYEPKGKILDESGQEIGAELLTDMKPFFLDGFLSSNGRVNPPDDANHPTWYAIGDPTEAAFMTLAMKAGFDPSLIDKEYVRVVELPFDSDRKRMTIVREHKGKLIGYMKGGVESVLSVCNRVNDGGHITPLDDARRKEIIKIAETYSGHALRVIALAYHDFSHFHKSYSIEKTEKDFVFAGFVTMLDPPRDGVKEAIQAAYDAHIKVMMITGDNAVTAKAIAESIGMRNPSGELPVFTGDEIKTMSDNDLKRLAGYQAVIFARVSPDDKYRLVKLFTEGGDVVAVTGDGVNDTLSLKQADIGVAMGQSGSEVAKEASEIVLLDDNFSTLVTAVQEGRAIFQNLKKAIFGNLTANFGELTTVLIGFIGVGFGLPSPLTAVQILAIDLIGEILPLMALTFDPPEHSLMKEPPRNLKDHVVNRRSLPPLFFYGFWLGVSGFFSFFMVYYVHGSSLAQAQTATYLGVLFAQYVNILSIRTERTIFTSYFWKNRQLFYAFLASLTMVGAVLYIPAISIWFGFGQLKPALLLYPVLGALVFLLWQEGGKWLVHRRLRV